MHIIQIGHKKRQGKDTFATFLKQHAEDKGLNVEIISFASPLKSIVAEALDISVETLEVLKNDSDHYRGVLQRFGSGKMKEYLGSDVWVDIALGQIDIAKANGCDLVIIPDFRFPNEFIDGAKTINVTRDSSYKGNHISETALDGFGYDIELYNIGTLESLSRHAKCLLESILKA